MARTRSWLSQSSLDNDLTTGSTNNIILECVPGETGIVNYSNTCYVNSVIQSLAHTRLIYLYFVGNNYKYDINPHLGTRGFISRAFADILRSLWCGRKKQISLNVFLSIISQFTPKFDAAEQHDAHEFLLAMLSWMHEELKSNKPMSWFPVQQSWVQMTQENHNVIMATFFGQIRNWTKCVPCNNEKSTYEMFNQLSLCLPPNGITTLEICLASYFEEQIISLHCQACTTTTNTKIAGEITSHPPVLVLQLKRYYQKRIRGNMCLVKNDITVRYPLENLVVFNVAYFLYAVIVHIGTLHNGHYISYCRHLINDRWYKYDDDHVTEVHKSQVLQPKGAFILFYRTQEEELTAMQLQNGL